MPFRFPPNDAIRAFCRRNTTYATDAYYFVQYAVAMCPKYLKTSAIGRHVSGKTLLNVIRQALLDLYGPCAIDVLDRWNVHQTEDFGKIVFQMVDMKLLGVSESDSIHDFDNGFDFTSAFVLPFRK